MKTVSYSYPPNPEKVPAAFSEPGPSFRRAVFRVLQSIILFGFVYVFLLILTTVFAIGCGYAAMQLLQNSQKLFSILGALGLMSLGLFVFIFMVKFMFSVSRYDRSELIEITEADQPRLMEFIRRLATDAQAPLPKKIYLSADVNASVFYDSSFWSMIFPVKKNLQIGLGLVNTLSITEFKAVIAHEFGHFSQRSMKLGSYVYHANRIIYNMLYENSRYDKFLNDWSSIHGIFAVFTAIAVAIAKAIQQLFGFLYKGVNKKYLNLSREMEFHADALAATVSGGNNLVAALHKLEWGSSSYRVAIQKCNELLQQKKIGPNFYELQRFIMRQMAREHRVEVNEHMPVLNSETMQKFPSSRILYHDQWASHPTLNEREKSLKEMGITATTLPFSAWVLFQNPETLEAALTEKLYQAVENKEEFSIIEKQELEAWLQQETGQEDLLEIYKGFYSNRVVTFPVSATSYVSTPPKKFEEIFSEQHVALNTCLQSVDLDKQVLDAIVSGEIDTQTFEFNGIRYRKEEAEKVSELLNRESNKLEHEIREAETDAVRYFMYYAGIRGEEEEKQLKLKYVQYNEERDKGEQLLKLCMEIQIALQPFYSGESLILEQITAIIQTIKTRLEPSLKEQLKNRVSKGEYDQAIEFRDKALLFLSSDYEYFHENSLFENEIQEISGICYQCISRQESLLKEMLLEILNLQLTYKSQ